MAGRLQEAQWLAQWERDGRPPWEQHFIKAGPWSTRYMCLDCGTTGYLGGSSRPYGWVIGCLIGHKTCDRCGVKTGNVGSHQQCKVHHQTCCAHFATNGGRLRERLASTALVPRG
jgi:hypothetical protein